MKDFGLKKLYYSISEVSKLTDLEQYILRYWETEFDELSPQKNRAGNRIYTNKDIELIMKIKKLLRDEKYTIEGAKKIISQPNTISKHDSNLAKDSISEQKIKKNPEKKREIKKDLEEIKTFLLDLKSKL